MDQDEGEATVQGGAAMPVCVAQHTASIRRVHFDGIGLEWNSESTARQKIPHDGLQVTVDQSAAGKERGQPFRDGRRFRFGADGGLSRGISGHESLVRMSFEMDWLDGARPADREE